jgi:hypothetical protein
VSDNLIQKVPYQLPAKSITPSYSYCSHLLLWLEMITEGYLEDAWIGGTGYSAITCVTKAVLKLVKLVWLKTLKASPRNSKKLFSFMWKSL